MANVTPETVLDNISHGHLDCPICRERFNNPKILKCRHNFCKTCLEDWMKAQPRDRQNFICCPVCRQNTVIPKAGIESLDGNFSLMALVDEVNQQEMLLKQQKSRITCKLCVETKQAIVRCLDCSEYLCQECYTNHKRVKTTTGHEVVTIDDLFSGKASYESRYRKEVPKCKKHDHQDLLFYCLPCETLICTACAAVDHRSHGIQDKSEASAECEQKISDLLEKVEERLKICKAAKDVAVASYNKHMMMVSDKQKVITQKADEDVARIRENEHRLKDQLLEISSKKQKQFQDLLSLLDENTKQTKDTLDRVKNDTFKITPFDLLKMQDSIMRDLQDAEGRSIPDPVCCLTSEDLNQSGTFTQPNPHVEKAFKKRPPTPPRPVGLNTMPRKNEGQKKVGELYREKFQTIMTTQDEAATIPIQVSNQVPEDEAAITPVAITPVQVSNQVPEDEAAITPVAITPVEKVFDQVPEDEAAITPVEKKEDIFLPIKKIDKKIWRRIIGGPQPNF